MPLTCTICKRSDRTDIDATILRREPLRAIARQFGLSKDSVARHKAHLPASRVKATAAFVQAQATQEVVREVIRTDSLLSDVRAGEGRAERLYTAAEDILHRALEAKELGTALKAITAAVDVMGEAREYMALRGELTGELNNRGQAPNGLHTLQVLMMPLVTQTTPGPAKVSDAPEHPAAKT